MTNLDDFTRRLLDQVAASLGLSYDEVARDFPTEARIQRSYRMATMPFRIGDIVTRDGTDLHRIIDMNGEGGDLIEVECIKEPLGYLNDDGTRDAPWTRMGDREWNLTRRYSHAGELIEGAMDRQSGLADEASES